MKCILKRMLASASLLALAAALPCAGQVAFTTNPAPGVKRRSLPKSILKIQHEEKSCTPSRLGCCCSRAFATLNRNPISAP
jgi:hypothetical protein